MSVRPYHQLIVGEKIEIFMRSMTTELGPYTKRKLNKKNPFLKYYKASSIIYSKQKTNRIEKFMIY